VLRRVGFHLIRGAILADVFPTSRGLWRASSHQWCLATSAGEESRPPSLYCLGLGTVGDWRHRKKLESQKSFCLLLQPNE
jgi:hypothetical protein